MDEAPTRLSPITCDLWLPRGPDIGCEVVRVFGREKLSEPYKFEIEIWCDDPDAPLDELLGADAELVLGRGGLERTVYGIIAAVDLQLTAPGRSERDGVGARLELVPALALLEHEVQTRFFTGRSVLEIVAAVLGERLGAYERSFDHESRIATSYPARDYCVQFRESNLAFCTRLLAEEGIAYVFEPDHDAQRERMVLVDANEHYGAAELLVAGPIAVERDRPEELERESVQSLDLRHAIASTRVVTRGHNYKLGQVVDEGEVATSERRAVERTRILEGRGRQIIDDPVGDPEAASFDGSALDQQAPLARRLLDSLRGEAALGRGRSNAIGFAVGTSFELEHALAGGTRQLLITSVEHHVQRDSGRAAQACSYHNELRCIPLAQPFRPKPLDKPRVQGVQTGVVVGKKPDEVHTDKLGRVQVAFPLLDPPGAEPELPSCWIRVAQVWAGQGYGAMVIPRVGMEVVVSFVDGDPDQPLITGCVYNATNPPPYELPEQLSKSTFKSSSTPGGDDFSELRIEDAKGSEQVFVRAQRRMDVRVAGTLYETATGGRETTVGNLSAPEAEPCLDIESVLGEKHEYVLRSTMHRTVGDLSLASRNTHEYAEESRITWVGTKYHITAPDVVTEASQLISQNANEVIVSGSETVSLRAGAQLVLESNNAVELRVGESFVSIHQGGVDIKGPLIRINSGGGAGTAREAAEVEAFELALPFEAIQADDGSIHKGTGGGGARRRERHKWPLEPHKAPDMVPSKLERPDSALDPFDATGTWIRIEWMQTEVWCSEPAKLAVVVEDVPKGATQSGFTLDAASGEVLSSFVVVVSAPKFEVSATVTEAWARTMPDDTVESSREITARLTNGLATLTTAKLRFLTSLPAMEVRDSLSRFSICVRHHAVVIPHTMAYVRGKMGRVISLGELADEDAGGLIGVKLNGLKDWRYCKPATVGNNPDRLAYWDGKGWRVVPEEFNDYNVLGDKLMGMWICRGVLGEVMTQWGKLPWPDPIGDWAPESLAKLEQRKREWSEAASKTWSDKFALRRDQCGSQDPRCCKYPIRVEVGFREYPILTQHVIVIGENDARANSETWSIAARNSTVSHEVGHHLGNPDEYPGAATVDPWVTEDGAVMGIDADGLMGSGSRLRRRYFDTIAGALAQLVEQELGKSFTFTPVEMGS